jgi:hypothetical protein
MMYDEVGFAAVMSARTSRWMNPMGFHVQRDIKNEEIKFETNLYYFSFALRVCMTFGIPAIESRGILIPSQHLLWRMVQSTPHPFTIVRLNFPTPQKQTTTQASIKETRMSRLPSRSQEELPAVSIT